MYCLRNHSYILVNMSVVLRFILCFYVISATYARTEEEIRSWFMSLGIECNKDFAITGEEMAQLHAHKIPDSENAKCLLACILKKATWINDKGMFDLDTANAFVEKEHLGDDHRIEMSKKLLVDCSNVNDESVSDGEKGCQRAALLTKCLTEKGRKMGIKCLM